MHEIGMLRQTAEIATRYAEDNNIDEVRYIAVEIGELSGALPDVFTEYFPYIVQEYPRVKNAELRLKQIPAEGLCSDCETMYNIMRCKGICPVCGSTHKKILTGRSIKLLNIAG